MDNKDMLKTYFVKKRKSIIFDNHCKNELLKALNNNHSNGTSINVNWALELLDIINLDDSSYNLQLINMACILDINPLVEKLITLNASMDSQEKDNSLKIACECGKPSAVRYLIKYGANINYLNNACLTSAIRHGHFEVVKELISGGADINFSNGEPLKIAHEFGHTEIVNLLVNNGAIC